MSELQNDDSAIEPDGEVIAEPTEATELATDSEGQHDKTDQVDEVAAAKAATQDIINKKTLSTR